jgi:hypothetical protein
MNTFHVLEPEVAGDLGQASVLDYSTQPPTVLKLQYEFNVWLGDDLLTSHPCFIVTRRLRTALDKLAGTGYRFDDVEITTAEGFDEISPHTELPHFYWMKVHGVAGLDDAGLTKDQRLVVSDRFLSVLRECVLEHCVVRRKPFRSPGTS